MFAETGLCLCSFNKWFVQKKYECLLLCVIDYNRCMKWFRYIFITFRICLVLKYAMRVYVFRVTWRCFYTEFSLFLEMVFVEPFSVLSICLLHPRFFCVRSSFSPWSVTWIRWLCRSVMFVGFLCYYSSATLLHRNILQCMNILQWWNNFEIKYWKVCNLEMTVFLFFFVLLRNPVQWLSSCFYL